MLGIFTFLKEKSYNIKINQWYKKRMRIGVRARMGYSGEKGKGDEIEGGGKRERQLKVENMSDSVGNQCTGNFL